MNWKRLRKLNSRSVQKSYEEQGRYKFHHSAVGMIPISFNFKEQPVEVGDDEASVLYDTEKHIDLYRSQVPSPQRLDEIHGADVYYKVLAIISDNDPVVITVRVSEHAF